MGQIKLTNHTRLFTEKQKLPLLCYVWPRYTGTSEKQAEMCCLKSVSSIYLQILWLICYSLSGRRMLVARMQDQGWKTQRLEETLTWGVEEKQPHPGRSMTQWETIQLWWNIPLASCKHNFAFSWQKKPHHNHPVWIDTEHKRQHRNRFILPLPKNHDYKINGLTLRKLKKKLSGTVCLPGSMLFCTSTDTRKTTFSPVTRLQELLI